MLSCRRLAEVVPGIDVLSCIPALAMYAAGLTATMPLFCAGELNNAVPVRALMSD
jgi:hypothetical protein